MSRSRKIAASLILTGGLVLSGVAAPAMAATGPAKSTLKKSKPSTTSLLRLTKKR
jgi:hypothetical protein